MEGSLNLAITTRTNCTNLFTFGGIQTFTFGRRYFQLKLQLIQEMISNGYWKKGYQQKIAPIQNFQPI